MSDIATEPAQAPVKLPPTDPVGWKGRAFPDADYRQHPAYAAGTSRPGLALRARALVRFLRALGYTFVRWLIGYEGLPLLSKERTEMSRLAFVRAYLWSMASTYFRRTAERATGKRSVGHQASPGLDRFRDQGFLLFRFSPESVERLRALSAPVFDKLRTRRANIPLESRKFDDNMYWLSRREGEALYAHVEATLREAGVIEVVSAYLGRQVGVKYVVPQLNDEDDSFWKRQFPDGAAPDPRTSFMHVDTTYNLCKFMFYVTPVERPEDGPFSYVRGTNNLRMSYFEGLVRRANEYSGLSSKKPEVRRLFSALPQPLRKKCDFGNDLLDDQPEADRLLAHEVSFYSAECDGILFDPNGVHRGGMVAAGERRVITVLLAES